MKKPVKHQTTEPAQPKENGYQSFASLCSTLVIGLFVLTFVFQNFVIPSASMASTLLIGDHVVVDRASLSPATKWAPFMPYRELRHGEPVVFYKPSPEPNGEYRVLVKRVIGLPGDRIHLRDGIVYLNGIAQDEPHAAKPPYTAYDRYRDEFPSVDASRVAGVTSLWSVELPEHIQDQDLVVPPDSYFMLGDNRDHSLDSRYWGFVHRDNLIGRPLFVYWSFDTPEDQIKKTSISEQVSFAVHQIAHFFTDTRWDRTLHPVR